MIGYLLLSASVFGADLLTKREAKKHGPERKPLPGGFLTTGTVYNSGFAGGRLADRSELVQTVSALSAAAALPACAAVMKEADSVAAKCGAALLLGGSAGNLYERFRYGKVTDFLSVATNRKAGKIIFNLADVSLLCGGILSFCASLDGLRKK